MVEHGTVTAAATALLVAQPALSRQIRVLERELKLSLFRSQGNRLLLTPGGQKFVPAARSLLKEAQMTESIAKQLAEGRLEQVIVAATAVTIHGFLASAIPQMPADQPLILTRSVENFEIYNALNEGADMVISPMPPQQNLMRRALYLAKICALVPPDHPLAQRNSPLGLEELADLVLALPTQNSVSRLELDNAMARSQRSYGKYFESSDDVTLLAIASSKKAVAISTWRDTPGLVSIPIFNDSTRTGLMTIRLHAAWHPTHFATETLVSLSEHLANLHRARKLPIPFGFQSAAEQ